MHATRVGSLADLVKAGLGFPLLTAPLGAASAQHRKPSAGCANGLGAFVGAGASNSACADDAIVGAGDFNTIAGGYHNFAIGQYSFAAGFGSYANTNCPFVRSDFSLGSKHLQPTAPNQFIARAAGGAIFLSNAAENTGLHADNARLAAIERRLGIRE